MFLFVTGIILTLSLGSVVFLTARKMPVLLTLTAEVPVSPKKRKPLFSRVKELNLARHKEILSIDNFKREKVSEDKVSKQQEFEKDSDYWNKVMDK
ncbi:MAG: hypothetical protein HQ539_00775 [Parcubacteria group bacterium]|nr:hypothetical protein [Parcubacteria group bacterium]